MLAQAVVMGMIRKSSIRSASTSTWIYFDDFDLIQEGLDIAGLAETEGSDIVEHAAVARSKRRMHFLSRLNKRIKSAQDEHIGKHVSWSSLPGEVGEQFLMSTPIGSVFTFSISISSSMRALFLTGEVMGALAMITFFCTASGGGRRKQQAGGGSGADCNSKDFAEMLGRLIVVGVVSALLSSLPMALLSRFHSREFKQLDYRNSPKWKQQLRRWRYQDLGIWMCGLAYILFCVNFMVLFFAAVVTQDQVSWVVSSFVAFFNDMLFVPIAIAFIFPFLATVLLAAASAFFRLQKPDVLALHKQRATVAEVEQWAERTEHREFSTWKEKWASFTDIGSV
mmetsp:Transcript_113998/g.254431  ORF Transcript_113998/g.254431 Transcript_113998/m.254431 type:complete len:338 (-) Transcript_113998:134-1147(-)